MLSVANEIQGIMAGNDEKDTSSTPSTPVVSEESKLSPDRVVLLGFGLILLGMLGFYLIPGLIATDAGGSHLNNAFYCSVITLTT